MNKKIAFCGCGNMGEAILRIMLDKKVAQSADITVNVPTPARREYLEKTYGIKAFADAGEATKDADIVIIAVLPKVVATVCEGLKDVTKKDALFISVAAGINLASMEEKLGADRKIVRVMPNTLNKTGNGFSAATPNANVTEDDKAIVTEILNLLGQSMYINEDMFNEFTAFSCTGPIWFYQMAESLIDAGVYNGFNRKLATEIVLKNMLGVAMVLNGGEETPKDMINEMCSPGGVTIEAYASLVEHGFSDAVMQSVKDAVAKTYALKK